MKNLDKDILYFAFLCKSNNPTQFDFWLKKASERLNSTDISVILPTAIMMYIENET